MFRFFAAPVLVAVLTTAACSSPAAGSSPSTSSYAAECASKVPLLAADACGQCVSAQCSAEHDHAIAQGVCSDLIECQCACTPSDGGASCTQSCLGRLSGTCADAVAALTSCEQSKCATECQLQAGPKDPACQSLQKCCVQVMSASDQNGCLSAVENDDGAKCTQALQYLQQMQECK